MPDIVGIAAVQLAYQLGEQAANVAQVQVAGLAGRADIVSLPEWQ